MSPNDFGVFVCATRAATADKAGGGSVAADNPVAARWLGRVREVQRACVRKSIALLWWQGPKRKKVLLFRSVPNCLKDLAGPEQELIHGGTT
jgi:hypothetical protein